MSASSLLKIRVFPSLDFTIGASSPPKCDNQRSGTEIDEDLYYFHGFSKVHREVITNSKVVSKYLERFRGQLSEEKILALFEAYEQEYLDSVRLGAESKARQAIEKIEALITPSAPLGLSVASISHKPRSKRGMNGITSYGKRMVRSGLAVLESKIGRKNLTLGTATLPGISSEDFEKICANWSEVVRKFFQELSRELERKGLCTSYAQVTEIQERRFSTYGDVGLHLHFVFQGRSHRYEEWRFTPDEIRGLWQRILENLLGREIDCRAATRIESCKTSLMGELGKYLSKGVTAIQSIVKAGKSDLLPKSWWGCDRSLKATIQSQIIVLDGTAAVWIDRNLKRLKSDGSIWYCDLFIELDGRDLRVGAAGRFFDVDRCKELLDCARSSSAF